ncbi:MAG: hypothetical protein HQK83_03880 [Fibrobacteria bacterium]|nr:hypothetical protein [Fibrobacteria bacterium]
MNMNDTQFSLFNDCQDLKFSISIGKKSSDSWQSYSCSLSIRNSGTGGYKTLYSSDAGSIISDISLDDIRQLSTFCQDVILQPSEKTRLSFVSETNDFRLDIQVNDDVFRVTAVIDLCTMSEEKLDAGQGDSEISLTFNCTIDEIKEFGTEIDNWLAK